MAQSVATAVGGIGDKLVNSLAKKVESSRLDQVWISNLKWAHLLPKSIWKKLKLCRYRGKRRTKLIVDGRNFAFKVMKKVFYWRLPL